VALEVADNRLSHRLAAIGEPASSNHTAAKPHGLDLALKLERSPIS
jgi:hypothetical protein